MSSVLYFAVLALVSADLAGDLGAVSSNADGLAGKVSGWSSGDGLAGALGIQQGFDPLSSAVGALKDSTGSASSSDIQGALDGISGLATAVEGLLSALTSKADDFKGVGATQIVTKDIDALSQPSADIISNLSKNAGSIPQNLADSGNSLGAAFSSAIQAFGGQAVQFPSLAAGGDSGSSASASASASGDASSAAPASSGAPAKSAAPVAPKNGTNGTTNGTATVEQTVVETVCTKEACTGTGVTPNNGAVRNGAVVGVIAAAAAALL